MEISEDILATVGRTPVVPLCRIVTSPKARVFGKYEAGNPSSSLKDRVALAIIRSLEQAGRLKSDSVMVAATSGNTGVALALVCSVRGYRLHLFMPAGASLEKRKMFASCGATLGLTKAEEGMAGAVAAAHAFTQSHPEAVLIDQFDDPAVVRAHQDGTALEILADFPQGVDAFVMGVGTGGTITGVATVLKARFPRTQIIAVEPSACSVLASDPAGKAAVLAGPVVQSKIQQLGLGFVPKNLRRDLLDRVITVSDSDAYLMTQRLAHEEGLLLGISSGANVVAALSVATELGAGKTVLTVFCDSGQRYFSLRKFFEE